MGADYATSRNRMSPSRRQPGSVGLMWPPRLLADRPRALQILIPIAGPVLTGAIGGWLLSSTKGGYLIYTTVMILGGIGSGMEHNTLHGGALRGFVGGVLFSGSILVVWGLIGGPSEATLPHPASILIAIIALISTALGVLGARLRRRFVPAAA
jgi:hypothetical protein